MKIKLAQKENIEELVILRINYLSEENSISKSLCLTLKENLHDYLEDHLNKDCYIFIAMSENKIISNSYINIYSRAPNLDLLDGYYGKIYGVYTIPEFRNNGIAGKVLDKLLEFTSLKLNIKTFYLDSEISAINLYKKLGFKRSELKLIPMEKEIKTI